MWTLVVHVWGYSPPTRIISTVCVSVYYLIHLYPSLYFGGEKKNMAFSSLWSRPKQVKQTWEQRLACRHLSLRQNTRAKKPDKIRYENLHLKKTAVITEKGESTVRFRCTMYAIRQFRFLIWNPPSSEWFYLVTVASDPCWNTKYTVAVNKQLPAVRKAHCRMRGDRSGCQWPLLYQGWNLFFGCLKKIVIFFLHWWKMHKPDQDDCFGMPLPVSFSWLTSPLCSSERSHNGEADHSWGTLWLVAPQGPVFTHDARTTDCCFSWWRLCSVCPQPAFPPSGPPSYAPPPTSGRSRPHLQPAPPRPRAPPCPLRAPPKPCFSGSGGSEVRPPTGKLASNGASCWLRASCCSYFFSRSFSRSHSLSGTGYTRHPQTSVTGRQFWHA